jgi:hypothetical protein
LTYTQHSMWLIFSLFQMVKKVQITLNIIYWHVLLNLHCYHGTKQHCCNVVPLCFDILSHQNK